MPVLSDKLILGAGCALLMAFRSPQIGLPHVLGLLFAIIFSCGCGCCNPEQLPWERLPVSSRVAQLCLWASLAVLSFVSPAFGLFLPLLFYELANASRRYFCLALCALPFLSFRHESRAWPWAALLLFLIAFLLSRKTKRLLALERDFRSMRDASMESRLGLQQRNKELMETQDYEIHIATLRERNRIAREIHDNVGHLLSRSILQSGALLAVNRQEELEEPLRALTQTLSSAMDSIRSSVHGLHDESIDLKAAASEMLSGFPGRNVHFDYDMDAFVPAPVKYCFLSILKEACANIAKHSDATEISVAMRIHPGFFQLIISDNGTAANSADSFSTQNLHRADSFSSQNPRRSDSFSSQNPGIGILNMEERARALNGHFSISTEHGFQIFVSIPQEMG